MVSNADCPDNNSKSSSSSEDEEEYAAAEYAEVEVSGSTTLLARTFSAEKERRAARSSGCSGDSGGVINLINCGEGEPGDEPDGNLLLRLVLPVALLVALAAAPSTAPGTT